MLLIMVLSLNFTQAQTRIDSLHYVLGVVTNDSAKVDAFNDLSQEYTFVDPYKAMEYALKALSLSSKIPYRKGLANSYNRIGSIYFVQTNYLDALDYYLRSLKINQQLGNFVEIAKTYNYIGSIYSNNQDYTKALEYLYKSLEIAKVTGDKRLTVMPNFNIGVIFENKEEFEKALTYYNSALKIAKVYRDDLYTATAYDGIASVYDKIEKNELAKEYYLKSMNIRKNSDDKYGLCSTYNSFGIFHINHGSIDKAIELFSTSLEIAQKYNFKQKIKVAAVRLSEIYAKKKQFQKAFDYLLIYKNIKDSLENNENLKKATQLEMQFEFDQKQRFVENEMNKKEFQKDMELTREKFIKNLLFVVVILMVSLILVILVLYRNSVKNNRLLAQQKDAISLQKIAIQDKNDELEKQKLAILSQHEIIEIQRDLATKQRDQIGKQNKEITDSISYASRIQKAMLPRDIFIEAVLKDYFIVYKPRDIVSGDFYWLSKMNDKIIIAVADCTGHGVPASFMSILGISLLKTIVNEIHDGMPVAAHILNKLRLSIIHILHQTGKYGASQDGMDISLCILDNEAMKIQFAGANSPILHLRTNKESGSVELKKIQPDKMPIGIHDFDDISFTNNEIDIQEGDLFYMYTDGYADQFGGSLGKKFQTRNLLTLIMDIYHKPMKDQKEIFLQTFENWRSYPDLENNPHDQVDDILVFGIKI